RCFTSPPPLHRRRPCRTDLITVRNTTPRSFFRLVSLHLSPTPHYRRRFLRTPPVQAVVVADNAAT
ncbi:hypothetical protein PIB30_112811, partial [Stylosanthes scabra]|nr:hypothetical protein [Stylosanthes scabra]